MAKRCKHKNVTIKIIMPLVSEISIEKGKRKAVDVDVSDQSIENERSHYAVECHDCGMQKKYSYLGLPDWMRLYLGFNDILTWEVKDKISKKKQSRYRHKRHLRDKKKARKERETVERRKKKRP